MPIATIDDARDFIRDYVNRRNVSAEEKLDIFIQEAYDELTQLDFAFWSQTVEVEIPKEAWDEYCSEDGRIPLWLIEASISAKTGKNYRIKKINDVWYKDEKSVSQIIKSEQGNSYYRVKIVNNSNQDGYFILRWEYLYKAFGRGYFGVPIAILYNPQLDVLYRPYFLRPHFFIIPLSGGEEMELWLFWTPNRYRYGVAHPRKFPKVKKIINGSWTEETTQDFSPPVEYLTGLRVPDFTSPLLYRTYHLDGEYQFNKPKAIIIHLSHHYNQPSNFTYDRFTLSFLEDGIGKKKFVLGSEGSIFYWKIGRQIGSDNDRAIGTRIPFPPGNEWFVADGTLGGSYFLYFFPDTTKILTRIEIDDFRSGGENYFGRIDIFLGFDPNSKYELSFTFFRKDIAQAEFTLQYWIEIDNVLDPYQVDVFLCKNDIWIKWDEFDREAGNIPTPYSFPPVSAIEKQPYRKLEYKKVSDHLRQRRCNFPVVWALEETTIKMPSLFLGYLAGNVEENTIYDVGKAIELSPIPNVKEGVKLKIKGKIVPRFWVDEPRIWQDLIEILAEMTYIKVLRYLDEDELANQKYVVLMQRLAGYVVDSQSISTSSFQPLRFSDYTLSEEEMFNF
jgi:hypothetical protein